MRVRQVDLSMYGPNGGRTMEAGPGTERTRDRDPDHTRRLTSARGCCSDSTVLGPLSPTSTVHIACLKEHVVKHATIGKHRSGA